MASVGRSRERAHIRWIGIIGAVVALLALPAMALASTPELLFNFSAPHGYTLLGSVNTVVGHSTLSVQIEKQKLQGKDVFYEQTYSFSGFPATYSASSTKATVSANLGAYGSVSLKFGDAKPAKVQSIKCPGSSKKTKIGKGEKLGTVTGSLSFNSQTSYFGTVTGHKSTNAELIPFGAFLSTRQAADMADPVASAAASSNGILACIPPLKGKLTYLTLNAQGGTPAGYVGSNTLFATRLGDATTLDASDDLVPLSSSSSVIAERSIAVSVLGHGGSGLYSFSPNLSSASAKAEGPFLSGSAKYTETTPCSNTKGVTYGSSAGAITAKFDEGGSVTYGGPGTVDEMNTIPANCDNPPPGAPG
jgi:hypothetical protein